MQRRNIIMGLLAGIGALAAPHAFGQAWPAAAPIKLVVPYPAGGVTDIAARVVSKRLGELLGQSVVVDNKAGAGGSIGTALVARAPADGYTLLMGTNATHGTNPNTFAKLSYDADKDFSPVIQVAQTPLLVVVHPSVPAKDIRELVEWTKRSGNQVSYASTGAGGGNHLTVEHFKMITGAQMLHVPYKGSSPALADLAGGQVQVMFDNPASSLPLVRSGKLRALAVTSLKRSAELPDVPTVAESGIPDFQASNWVGIYAPAGTPPNVVARLNEALAAALAAPEIIETLRKSGLEPVGGTPAQFAQLTRDDIGKWERVVKTIAYKPE
ncbi:tripartite tricarboxylate transporter substrate binding protein [Ramlibacter tataouinensis]|uniref:Bug family tripartite tricarboxylate transporter substrate binding protein n=1 Tax=Ramlibacter tataouinensis TaxID=94132 RepID=UPI0022F390B0|nr:tripartite tricarboxylate transporter substrate binding protein [Ramlibacter tataouinensis]WBY02779.1 tripartite tricarboxylate transporter substrate binding protein [Ramlibacter tataouinensis]